MNKKYIFWSIGFVLLSIILIGFIISTIANTKCKRICDSEGALVHSFFAGGGWFTIKDDVCVCYFEDDIKTFKLGDKNGG